MVRNKHYFASLFITAALLSGCSEIPKEAYSNRTGPEALLDVSLETVNVPLDSFAGVDELTAWVNNEQPSRAELQCAENSHICMNAERVLEQFAVPVTNNDSPAGNQVVLYYERILARDCDPKYVDNHINPYNLNYQSFGCSVSANTIQMVSDRRQFVNPALLDFPDASKARQAYRGYMKAPSEKNDKQGAQRSLLSDVADQ